MNQDFVYATDERVGMLPDLYIVADGMGGHKAGEYASQFTAESLVHLIGQSEDEAPERVLFQSLQETNRLLRRVAASDEKYYGMGTTCVLCSIVGTTLYAANVGDSRLYVRSDRLRQVTVDHSLVEEMILAGSIDEQRARRHPDKNIITRAIGADDDLEIDFFREELSEGDCVLMCTDGLTNMLEDDQIDAILAGEGTLADKAQRLVDAANEAGGLDNISVILAAL